MMEVKIIIEKSKDHFSAYAENIEGIYGAGSTIEEVKKSIEDAISIYKEYNDNVPFVLKKNYKLVFLFDTQSLLEYYGNIFTRAALSRLTGINEKQLGHYIQGLHKPRKDKAQIIETALHKFGNELLSVEFS